LFDWWRSRKPLTEKFADKERVGFFGPHAILEELRTRVPQYLDEADHGKLIYPACKRAFSDSDMFAPFGTKPDWKRCDM
jgi:hypothetical protein